MVGRVISHYEIVEKIGEGGMGVVWKARDTRLKRLAALKFLPPALATDPECKRRFTQEARAASSLSHPNIVTIYEIACEDGVDFIAMEYVVGQTLRRLIPSNGLETSDTLKYAVQIATALAAAHGAGVVHRDLKPGNILVNQEGLVKVVDFGLAKLTKSVITAGDRTTTMYTKGAEGVLVGTVSYMSPEQAKGENVDRRSDIFAFGAVLYEMVTGKRAFKGNSTVATLTAVLHEQPTPLRYDAPNVPHELEKIIGRCLRKDRERRFQHADDLKVSLLDLRDEYQSLVPEAALTKVNTLLGHWRKWALLAAGLVSLAVLIWWAAVWNKPRVVPTVQPLIVLMDTSAPMGVYDSVSRRNGGTNADEISDDLRDLPVTLHKENIGSVWDREDQVLKQNPDLIIIHLSVFFHGMNLDFQIGYPPFNEPETEQSSKTEGRLSHPDLFLHLIAVAQSRLETFLGYAGLANSKTKFLVYSRGRPGEWSETAYRNNWAENAEQRFPVLKNRVFTINIEGGEKASFRDPRTAEKLRASVESILKLSSSGASTESLR